MSLLNFSKSNTNRFNVSNTKVFFAAILFAVFMLCGGFCAWAWGNYEMHIYEFFGADFVGISFAIFIFCAILLVFICFLNVREIVGFARLKWSENSQKYENSQKLSEKFNFIFALRVFFGGILLAFALFCALCAFLALNVAKVYSMPYFTAFLLCFAELGDEIF